MVSYTLRRSGYLQARTTLSRSLLGSEHYPPKFVTRDRYQDIRTDLYAKEANGEISSWDRRKQLGSYIQVANARGIIAWIAGAVGLGITYGSSLDACADEYTPVSKSAIAAIKEVAGWSGADCYLTRSGTLLVYDFNEKFNRGQSTPQPATVVAIEEKAAIFPINQVTVVGSGYAKYWVPAVPGRLRPPGGNPNLPEYDPGRPGYLKTGERRKAVEVTESVGDVAPVVEQRIEINEYPINPALALKLAQATLGKAVLSSATATFDGPATGSCGIEPVLSKVFSVRRTLNWNGTAYRHLITIVGPRVTINFPGGESTGGWW
jgi:hypothetical protein